MVCRFMVLEIAEAIVDILDGDPNVSMEHILAQLTAQFPDIPHPGFEGGTLQMYVEEQVETYRRGISTEERGDDDGVANGSIGGQGVTARGNPTGRGVPCAPVVGGAGAGTSDRQLEAGGGGCQRGKSPCTIICYFRPSRSRITSRMLS